MKSRTRARSVALQVLYEVDISGHNPAEVLQERLGDIPLDDHLSEFSRQIIYGVLQMEVPLDQFITQHAPEWPLDQVAVIDRNILRIALWEFGVEEDTPIKVAINEAIELAKLYGSDSTPRFVNGVLGSLANRQNEIHQLFARFKKA
ncbi:MAG: transcription antitermination factor NusB [Anaerolineaceae bacterium]|nr:transcription antitermination factor NusB [Anaerolineaceae bacterium]